MLDAVAIERQEEKKLPGLRVGWAMANPAHPADTALPLSKQNIRLNSLLLVLVTHWVSFSMGMALLRPLYSCSGFSQRLGTSC